METIKSQTGAARAQGKNASISLPVFLQHFKRHLIAGFAHHLPVHLIAIICVGLALVIGTKSGIKTDFSTVFGYSFSLMRIAFQLLVAAITIWFVQLEFIEKAASPTKVIWQRVKGFFVDPGRLAAALHVLVAFVFFVKSFTALKASIAILNPFSFDLALRDLDRFIHFGALPHEILSAITNSPLLMKFFDKAYELWYVIIIGSVIGFAAYKGDRELRLRYLTSFFMLWFIGGNLVAFGFSSAGPCFFEPLGFGSDYQPLMMQLEAISSTVETVAPQLQQLLWESYAGNAQTSLGISAFPSLHVASTTLLALGLFQLDRRLGIIGSIFALVIFIGSIVLGWHYAVDGYAGAIIAVIIWWQCPYLLKVYRH